MTSPKQVENYGRTWRFRPSVIAEPKNVDDLRRIVTGARNVRVMGSRHSWSKAIVTDGTLVSLDAMCRLVHVDKENLRVTVQAGIKLNALIAELEKHGLALANLGSIDKQSLAGALSTGTHGTGLGFQCLAAQVESFKLVDGEGAERHLDKLHTDFAAVLVGLGCFGVVHEVTLSVVPSFQMHALTDTAPFDDVIENLDSLVRGYDHFKFWWLVPSDKVIVFKNNRTNAPRNDSDLTRWFKDEFLAGIVYRAVIELEKLDRKRVVPFANRSLGREVGKRFERVCKSHVGFLTPFPPAHRETEWAFDYAGAQALLREYRRLLSTSGHTYSFVQEVRFTKGDDFWLSPAFGRDSMWLSMYNIDSPAHWDDQVRRFYAFAKDHGGRPHWGKEADFDPAYLKEVWPKLGAFRELQRAYDPKGRFMNGWAAQLFRD